MLDRRDGLPAMPPLSWASAWHSIPLARLRLAQERELAIRRLAYSVGFFQRFKLGFLRLGDSVRVGDVEEGFRKLVGAANQHERDGG